MLIIRQPPSARRPYTRMRSILAVAAVLCGSLLTAGASAGTVRAAVAANFTAAAQEIGDAFTAASGHDVRFSFGSTGQLYAQISQGAPFDVFLAADQARPARAEDEGLAATGTRFTYATGAIALFSMDPDLVKGEATLRQGDFTRLAIANPEIAPYGAAAVGTMQALGVFENLRERIVRGNNIAQVYQFVTTGNAELGFIALSQLAGGAGGSHWVVPPDLYPPIAQDAVLLAAAGDVAAARAFLDFLRGEEANAIKDRYGYGPGN